MFSKTSSTKLPSWNFPFFPKTNSIASMIKDLPTPVSPVNTFSPSTEKFLYNISHASKYKYKQIFISGRYRN
jgi:hypothetical protein